MREGEGVWQCVTYTNDMTQRPHVCLSTPLNFPHIHGFFPPYPLHCTATFLNWLFVQHFKTCKDKSESNKDLTPGTLTFLQYLTKHRTLKLKTSQLQNQFILKDEDKISSELSNSGLYSIFELHNIFRSCWRSYELWVSHVHYCWAHTQLNRHFLRFGGKWYFDSWSNSKSLEPDGTNKMYIIHFYSTKSQHCCHKC